MAEFKLPEVGEGIEAGTVVAVLVKVGDTIEKDQPVLELETDKAVVEVPSSVAGVVTAINVKTNEEAKVGQVVLSVDEAGAEATASASGASKAGADEETDREPSPEVAETLEGDEARQTDEAADQQAAAEKEQAQQQRGGEVPATKSDSSTSTPKEEGRALIPAAPSVRRLAREMGVDIARLSGSGILGRISAQDVRQAAEGGGAPAPTATPAAASVAPPLPDFGKWGEVERKPMSGIRKATVRSMAQAWSSVPMVTHFDKADITEFEALRKRYQPQAEKLGAKLTPTAMLIKIVAAALRKFPDFNASVDAAASEVVYKQYVNVGVAVDTDAGLLVPVIKHADRKNMLTLAQELGELAEKARARKLTPDDMQGGNFNVSNLGGIGGTGFTPIVNPPDVAILGVARGGFEPVYDPETGGFVPRMMMPLSLTYDHRLIDGAQAARFLRWVCRAVEEPFLTLLEG